VQGINDLATPFICVFLQEYVTVDVLEVADMKRCDADGKA
jgi:hypothetical protein